MIFVHKLRITISLLLLSIPSFGQSSERPETIVIPVSSLGEVSEVRKQILQNTLEDELKSHFRLISQERFEEVQEKVFEELEYDECTEDQCIVMIQEMLQVENVFHLQVLGEGDDTQLSLSWRTLDEKKKEEEFCEGCGTGELRKIISGLVVNIIKFNELKNSQKNKNKDGIFVSVGSGGMILKSSDGNSWEKINSRVKENLEEITFGNKIYVTVGWSGTILTSTDGINWVKRNSKTNKQLYDVTFGNGLFIIVGTVGTILSSKDGIIWSKMKSGTDLHLFGVDYSKMYISVGFSKIYSSFDGITWNLSKNRIYSQLWDITFGLEKYVSVGWNLKKCCLGSIFYSYDGLTWSSVKNKTKFGQLNGVTFGNGVFVTVGPSGMIMNSRDGITWTQVSSNTKNYLYGVKYLNKSFYSYGKLGTILHSNDGIRWKPLNTNTNQSVMGITYTNN